MTVKPAIIPCLRYADAPAAIDFLCTAFGFERHAVYADDKDPSVVHHAQLTDRGTMIMLASLGDSDWAEKPASGLSPRPAAIPRPLMS